MTTAILDMERAYLNVRLTPNLDPLKHEFMIGLIGGATLTPGVYTWTTGITIHDDITLEGTADSVFILQSTGVLALSANKKVILSGGVQAKNVYWQIAGNAVVITGAHMAGILLVKTNVDFQAGSTLDGSIYAQTACSLISAKITKEV